MGLEIVRNPGISIQIGSAPSLNRHRTRKSFPLLFDMCMCMSLKGKACYGQFWPFQTSTRQCEADSRTEEMLCGDTDSLAACLLALPLTRWWGFSSFTLSLSPPFCCGSRRGQRAVIKLCLHPSPHSPSISSAGGLQQQGAPDSQLHLPPPN